MNGHRVSVVMSVYNGERHLAQSVESVLAQTFSDFEFLIVNDGSTDGTRDLLAGYEARDKRIRVLNQGNAGLTLALCRGCEAAKGELIARQDADDWSEPTRLKKLVSRLEAVPDAVMAGSWAAYLDDDGQAIEVIERPIDPAEATRRLLYEKCGPPAHGSVMFRRRAYESVGGYRSCFYYAQDSDLWLRLGQVGQIVYVPELLYYARLSPHGISSSRADWQIQFGDLGQACHAARLAGQSEEPFLMQAEQLRKKLLATKVAPRKLRKQQAAAHYRMGTSLSRQAAAGAHQHFWSAVRLNPLHWRAWCRLCAILVRPKWLASRHASHQTGIP